MVIGISGLELRQNPWLFHSSSSSSSSSSSFQIIQKSRNLNTVTSSYKQQRRKPPLFVSTKPSDINLHDLTDLFTLCNHSCYRFPEIDSNGEVNAVDIDKLKIALSHSAVVVSVFCNPNLVSSSGVEFDDFLNRLVPVTQLNGKLVGFGRAISDLGLTASIHDIMVNPLLRRMGIGRTIVQRIVRVLTSREIYDISALCSAEERTFFKACGFGDDILNSTTMMYSNNFRPSKRQSYG